MIDLVTQSNVHLAAEGKPRQNGRDTGLRILLNVYERNIFRRDRQI